MKTIIKIEEITGDIKRVVTIDTEDKTLVTRILEDAEIIRKVVNVEVVQGGSNNDLLEYEKLIKDLINKEKITPPYIGTPWPKSPYPPYITPPYVNDFPKTYEITC